MDIYPLSASLEEIQNYLTIIEPFDKFVWWFSAVSVISITLTITFIDRCYTSWNNWATCNQTYNSMYDKVHLLLKYAREGHLIFRYYDTPSSDSSTKC